MEKKSGTNANFDTLLALLEQDMSVTKEAVANIIKNTAKLNDVAADVAKILAVHNERIETGEMWSKEIRNDLKEHMLADSKTFERLFGALEDSAKKITEAVETQHDKFEDRLSSLERWKWLVMGGCMVAGALLGKLSFVSAFFNLL